MKAPVRLVALSTLVLLLASARADAALVAVTDPTSPGGVDNVTHDPATGMDWLDLTASSGISYDDITLQFASGGSYEGWRHATRAEVLTLLTGSAGLSLGDLTAVDPLAVQFVGLLGTTASNSFPNATFARGRYNDDASGTLGNAAGTGQVGYGTPTLVNGAFTNVSVLDDQPVINSVIPSSGTGHWLVRAVPEPSSAILVGLGTTLLGVQRRRGACRAAVGARRPSANRR